jgi:Ser/Thr protein kinase RdoA (MazF antagonist)
MSGPSLPRAGFDLLSPDLAAEAIEEAYGLDLDGSVFVYPSYVNRVYGFRDDEGQGFVAKFYRPGRWSREAILDECAFVADCAAAEIPVVPPLPNSEGDVLSELALEDEGGEEAGFFFSLFPKRGGRNFEPESEADWLRLGSLAGRLHAVGRARTAPYRLSLSADLGASYVRELLTAGLVHPDSRGEFEELAGMGIEIARDRLAGLAVQRVHGDLHRGNILDRPGLGLLLVDFDDMLNAPTVQDLWLLLPGRKSESGRELALILEGYEEFSTFDPASLRAIEALRLLRMLYFLSWRSRQRGDYWFRREFPEWGNRAFWLREVEDLRDQLQCLKDEG